MFPEVPIPRKEGEAEPWLQAALADLRAALDHGKGIEISFDKARPYPPLYHQLHQAFSASPLAQAYRLKTKVRRPVVPPRNPTDSTGYALIAWLASKEA